MKLAFCPPPAQFMTAVCFLNTILTCCPLISPNFRKWIYWFNKEGHNQDNVILPVNLYLALFHFLKKAYAYQITVLFLYVRVSSFQLLNQLTKFHENLYDRNIFEDHFSALFFSFLQSVISTTWWERELVS
jgi:hypothetical protein